MTSSCIVWTKRCNASGYGVKRVGSRTDGTRRLVLVHRWVWEQERGPIPDGLFVLHHCDNPPCYKLEHLFLGTRTDNNNDRNAKGRNTGLIYLELENLARAKAR